MEDETWREQFEIVGQDPENWLDAALPLKQLAENGWTPGVEVDGVESEAPLQSIGDLQLWPARLLLAGVAIELLAKGLLVARDPSLVQGGALAPHLTNHNLSQLLQKGEVVLDAMEEDLVKRLAVFIRWAGRYPIPINLKTYRAEGSAEYRSMDSSDPMVFGQLFERLAALLRAEASVGRHRTSS